MFQKVIDDYPDHNMASYAQFMIGRVYEELIEKGLLSKEECKPLIVQAYLTLLENYPDCKAKPIAEKWLSKNYISVEIPGDSNQL